MPTPDFGECGEGVIIDEREPFPPTRVTQRPRVYLGKRVHPRGPRARNDFLGAFRYLWFEKNGEVLMHLIHLGTLRIVPCHPEEGPLKAVIQKKAIEQASRDVYETKTGQSAMPGTGPLDLIRKFADTTVPKQSSGTRRRKGGAIPEIGQCVNGVVVDNKKPFKAWALAQDAVTKPKIYLGRRVPPQGPLATGNQTEQGAKLLWFEKDGVITPLWVITWSLEVARECQPDTKRAKLTRDGGVRMSRRKTLRKRK